MSTLYRSGLQSDTGINNTGNGIASKDMLYHCSYVQILYLQVNLDYFLVHLLIHLEVSKNIISQKFYLKNMSFTLYSVSHQGGTL